MRNGHTDVLNYRMDFVAVALSEIEDAMQSNLRYNALSHRLSKLENDEFTKFISNNPVNKADKPKIDHEAQLRDSLKG